MIYRVTGTLVTVTPHCAVIETGGVSFQLFLSARAATELPPAGTTLSLFTYLHVREDALELYGFLREPERNLFERLNSVSGIGPKSALGILNVATVEQLVLAINEGNRELLTRASGIGKKTAERLILDLKGKLAAPASRESLARAEADLELEETLVSLGFTKAQAKTAVKTLDPNLANFKERLKAALKKKS